jgi:hypothetical protein
MKIRMKSMQVTAVDNGMRVVTHGEGEVYEVGTADMPTEVAEAYLEDGRAEEVKPKSVVHEEVHEVEDHAKRTPGRPGPRETK